jgi:hypothetical protein
MGARNEYSMARRALWTLQTVLALQRTSQRGNPRVFYDQ